MFAASFSTSFGRCSLAWNDSGLTRFFLPGDAADTNTETTPPDWVATVIARVQRHFDGDFQDFSDVRLDLSRLTPFQERVYTAALKVKAGETRTYGWLAHEIGSPQSSRAVGTALGRNPWLLLVPCHRFVGADGKLTGFSAPGGIATKRRMLAHESAATPVLCAPL
jgi:methylated-DNA-[protein]-cysteine S-methyltransferase